MEALRALHATALFSSRSLTIAHVSNVEAKENNHTKIVVGGVKWEVDFVWGISSR